MNPPVQRRFRQIPLPPARMRILWPVLGLLAVLAAAPASGSDHARLPIQLIADPQRVPLARVLKQIESRIPGRALDAKLREQNEQSVYRVKWLGDDGKVRVITADAHSGKIINVR